MPGRRFMGFQRRRPMRPIIDSVKNQPVFLAAVATGANTINDLAVATDTAPTANQAEVMKGSKIFRIWLELSYTLTATTVDGVSTVVDIYIIKNPGNNLTPPNPGTVGTSNEKKFIFKTWRHLVGARSQGVQPYSWKGWIKVPKIYQRMGTDDTIEVVSRATGIAGVICMNFIYKYYK